MNIEKYFQRKHGGASFRTGGYHHNSVGNTVASIDIFDLKTLPNLARVKRAQVSLLAGVFEQLKAYPLCGN